MEKIRLGLIGLSPGNGHPFSWGAICNGYDPEAMATCPFPVIPDYLGQQEWPAARLPNVEITHLWTQDEVVSESVAQAVFIPNVCANIEDMIGQVDAVLLARDDAENHLAMAEPLLRAGLPVYVDKPLATDMATANALAAATDASWKLFSCSALRCADELMLTDAQKEAIGPVRSVDAIIPKAWETYAVHIIEPALRLLDNFTAPTAVSSFHHAGQTQLSAGFANGQTLYVKTMGDVAAPLNLRVIGEHGNVLLTFADTFNAFRKAIALFLEQVRGQQPVFDQQETMAVIRLIEKGLR